ncbi:MAG: hypothetical protein V4508_09695 [Pseudomonadota bacterium]
MSILIQTTAAFPVFPLVRGMLSLSAFAGLVVFFKPLLVGIARALMLLFKPHRSKAELAARSHMRDAILMQNMINACNGASHASELRAMAARN